MDSTDTRVRYQMCILKHKGLMWTIVLSVKFQLTDWCLGCVSETVLVTDRKWEMCWRRLEISSKQWFYKNFNFYFSLLYLKIMFCLVPLNNIEYFNLNEFYPWNSKLLCASKLSYITLYNKTGYVTRFAKQN